MGHKKGMGLLMDWVDVRSDQEENFLKWYDEEQLPRIRAVPGVLNAARYVALRGGPKHLGMYELDCPEVVEADEFKKIDENPSPRGKQFLPGGNSVSYMRNLYRLIFPDHIDQVYARAGMAPVLQMGRMDVPLNMHTEFNRIYNTSHVLEFEKVEGCNKGRRFVAVNGQPKYMTIYEVDDETVAHRQGWVAIRDDSPIWIERIRPIMTHGPGSPCTYKKVSA